jgi:hypothetical protein
MRQIPKKKAGSTAGFASGTILGGKAYLAPTKRH